MSTCGPYVIEVSTRIEEPKSERAEKELPTLTYVYMQTAIAHVGKVSARSPKFREQTVQKLFWHLPMSTFTQCHAEYGICAYWQVSYRHR